MTRFPVQTTLPGLRHVELRYVAPFPQSLSANFTDKLGSHHVLQLVTTATGFNVEVNGTPCCSFEPWDSYNGYWRAGGMNPIPADVGIGTAIYFFAREMLKMSNQGVIAPSDNLTENGMKFWKRIDPGISWEKTDKGFRPDLTGLSPP